MSANPKPQEPSMDEILASIRRIISDDDAPSRREAPPNAKDVPPRRGLGDDTRFAPSARPEPSRRSDSAPRQEAQVREPPRQPTSRQDGGRPVAHDADGFRPASSRQSDQEAAAARQTPPRPTRDPFAEPVALGLDRYEDPAAGWDEVGGSIGMPYSEDEDMADYPAPGDVPPRAPVSQPATQAQPTNSRADTHEPAAWPAASRTPDTASRPFGDSPRRKDLLSPAVDAAVAAAFESLGDMALPSHERTVEDLVKEILRPMLKEWLDANLPAIVERLVRAEIERVSRTAR